MAVALAIAGAATPATARDYGAPARSMALGDAVWALGMGTAGLYVNPATMGQLTQYAIDAGYGFANWSGTHDFHSAFVDSQTNDMFPGGAGYTYFRSDRDGDSYEGHDVRAALAGRFSFTDVTLAIGVTVRYLNVSGDLVDVNAATFDAGLLLGIVDHVYIGVTGNNLVSLASRFTTRAMGLGLGLVWAPVSITGGVSLDFESRDSVLASPAGGIEIMAGNMFAIRAGFTWERLPDQKRVCGGLGFVSQYVGVDLGYTHDVTSKDNWGISASIRAFLP
jgi:hypothetical protein